MRLGFSSILTGLNFIVTIHKLRAPGMTWYRMPLFVWAIYATAIVQVLATPVLAITLLLLIVERTLNIGIFDPAMGGDPVLFQHFFWFYKQGVFSLLKVRQNSPVVCLIRYLTNNPAAHQFRW